MVVQDWKQALDNRHFSMEHKGEFFMGMGVRHLFSKFVHLYHLWQYFRLSSELSGLLSSLISIINISPGPYTVPVVLAS